MGWAVRGVKGGEREVCRRWGRAWVEWPVGGWGCRNVRVGVTVPNTLHKRRTISLITCHKQYEIYIT